MSLSSNAQVMKLGDLNHDNQVNITDVMTLVDIVLHGYSPFSVSPTEVTMQAGGTAKVAIDSGYYYYEVESANTDIVEASLNDMTITLTAVGGGETTVTVKDVLTFRTIDILVNVEYDALPVSTNELTLVTGEQGKVTIPSGSGYYSVKSSDVNVATANVSRSTVTVTAVGAGTATITITDTKTGQMANIEVTVNYPPITLSSSSLGLSIGDEGWVRIISNSGNYSVHSSDAAVATANLEGLVIKVTAVGGGITTITVTDTESGLTADIEVTVSVSHECPDDHHPHMIDLGLPSGTKWACCNVEADKPEDFGGYYAWGETEVKDAYNSVTYQYITGVDVDGDGWYDSDVVWQNIGSDIGGTQYDVAHVKWGGSWMMPSLDKIKELVDNCTYSWISMNGVEGGKFTGPNGSSIFLPAAGYREEDYLAWDDGSYGDYWSSTQHTSELYSAFCLGFFSNYSFSLEELGGDYMGWGYMSRECGHPVRPVLSSNPSTDFFTLSSNSIEINVHESSTIEITSGNGIYEISNTNSDVVTVSLSGTTITITGKASGIVTITVTDTKSGKKATIEVTVSTPQGYLSCPDDHHPHMIDLGLPSGTKWACCNVDDDASKQSPANYGGYYAWGETETKSTYSWSNYIHCDGSYENCHNLGSDIAGTQYDVAHVKWGGSWVMPSKEQQDELKNSCTYEWTTVNGVKGWRFTSKINGCSIFLPAAGNHWGGSLFGAGSYGSYWSSMEYPSESRYAYDLVFDPDDTDWSYDNRYYGFSVRPVSR